MAKLTPSALELAGIAAKADRERAQKREAREARAMREFRKRRKKHNALAAASRKRNRQK
jgi:hypothetical protein